MYSKFREIYQARHEYAQSFSEKGVMGYICTLVPEEVVYAAGFLPVRLIGAHQPSNYCRYVYPPYILLLLSGYTSPGATRSISLP